MINPAMTKGEKDERLSLPNSGHLSVSVPGVRVERGVTLLPSHDV